MRLPIHRKKKGIPAGVITRKEAFRRDSIVAPPRRQRRMGAMNYGETGRNDVAKLGAGGNSQ